MTDSALWTLGWLNGLADKSNLPFHSGDYLCVAMFKVHIAQGLVWNQWVKHSPLLRIWFGREYALLWVCQNSEFYSEKWKFWQNFGRNFEQKYCQMEPLGWVEPAMWDRRSNFIVLDMTSIWQQNAWWGRGVYYNIYKPLACCQLDGLCINGFEHFERPRLGMIITSVVAIRPWDDGKGWTRMWGAALLITQHCVSGRLGPIEVDANLSKEEEEEGRGVCLCGCRASLLALAGSRRAALPGVGGILPLPFCRGVVNDP